MAQVIALLGAIAALFWAINSLQKSGALSSLNPFALLRRLKEQRKLIDRTMETLNRRD